MYKKVYVPLILALVAALSLSSVAFAAAGTLRRDGTVLSVDLATGTFKFDTLSGVHYTIHVSSATTYVGKAGLSVLRASDRVDLEIRMRASDGTWWAERVKFVPLALETRKEHGIVTSIGSGWFTIKTRENESYTYQVTSKTTFSGLDVPHLREVDLGDAVTVTFRGAGTPTLWAMHVLVTQK